MLLKPSLSAVSRTLGRPAIVRKSSILLAKLEVKGR